MRALCGAIITAAALIGLGLTAIGIGTRYTRERGPNDEILDIVRFGQMDTPLQFLVVFLTAAAVVGMGIAILGLAYHHARREREWDWHRQKATSHQRTSV